ncbi:hypothetical protein Pcinc_025309, partial [Petrolisthes cinctipes]
MCAASNLSVGFFSAIRNIKNGLYSGVNQRRCCAVFGTTPTNSRCQCVYRDKDPHKPSSQVEVTVNHLKEKASRGTTTTTEGTKGTTTTAEVTKEPPTAAEGARVPTTAAEGARVITNTTVEGTKGPPTTTNTTTLATTTTTTAEEIKGPPTTTEEIAATRKTLWVRIKEEVAHYYHGFRLLLIDTKIGIKFVWRVANGETLSRREYRQLIRTTSDLFRLLPFSVFIIIPFMEFLLPVALKLFPGMLPSTFETANEKEAKIRKKLKVKLEMAKFLQQTLDSMAVEGQGRHSHSAKAFVMFFEKITKTGGRVSNDEILKFSKLFEDEITLDSLSRPQLVALCRLLEMQPFGTNNFLRFQLRMKLRSLAADDKIIQGEGVDSLAVWELQQACRQRGMRAYGLSEERLKLQLHQWLELSLKEKVPPSLLLLSRTLYLPDIQTDTLAATISTLPEEVATRTKAAIGKRDGKIDNLTRLQVIKSEEKKIKEDKEQLEKEKEEKEKEKKKKKEKQAMQQAIDAQEAQILATKTDPHITSQSPTLITQEITQLATEMQQKAESERERDKTPPVQEEVTDMLTTEDLRDVQGALENISVEKNKQFIEEQELSDLKNEMADYQQDIEQFKQALIEAGIDKKEVRESKAARRLYSRVNKMVGRMEPILTRLGQERHQRKKRLDEGQAEPTDKAELVTLEELEHHLGQIYHAADTSKVSAIGAVLATMDRDHDGAIEVDQVLQVLQLLNQGATVSPKMFEEVVQTLAKEEKL